jgi:hypothetical protein
MIPTVWRILIAVGYILIGSFISWRFMRNQYGFFVSIAIGYVAPFGAFCLFYLIAAAVSWVVVGKI